ncbi:tannase/feruloyl esterase family alpha/beta hydrolase [Microbacterium immunditiarum]|uniref:tannase/feruloyl esterase family alpha/beta hydrolase n=1 Tax=Microbacterium immunditiarum TaxID=337480 RepID=UPI0015CA8549|nr:tannase/feruloyl esterase family alpha/beta hydrolase [Microbacterium immunditiarum]
MALAVASLTFVAGGSAAGDQGSAAKGPATPGDPVRSCESLMNVDLGPNTVIESAVQHAATATTPASCRVQLYTTHPPAGDEVTIWIALPTTGWNGRFLGVGGGGFTGGTPGSVVAPLGQGFAAGATDAGNPTGQAQTIGANPDLTRNWVGQENFGHRGIHEMTVNGKELVAAYYGRSQDYAYFSGCSTGGRQGMMEAQKYPDDYDGISAGAPVFNYAELAIAQLWSQIVMKEEGNVLSQCKFTAALEAGDRRVRPGG